MQHASKPVAALRSRRKLVSALFSSALSASLLAALSPACGGAKPGATSPLSERTLAGQKCNPKNHDRPFIIEWDATDQSSFQARSSSDVIFVKYEGCDLKVLYGCNDDSVKGAFGAYKTVDWTAGQLEAIDIKDEGELYAKLPLGAATLGGRVSSGEAFHMEYFVSGTRNATRDKIYRNEIDKIPACKGATHFVYGYNLGAFALASKSSLKGEVGGSYFGFGAGGSKSTETKADKQGGELTSCKSDSAKEVDTCKVPIRLTLREISDGDNPDKSAAQAPETDEAKNLAGKLKAETDAQREADSHFKSANEKLRSRDGKGCLSELDAHDKLDTRADGLSSNPKAGYAPLVRAQCLMLSGQCDAGKQLYRKAWEAGPGAGEDPQRIDTVTNATAGMYCQGGKMSDKDKFLQARMTLQEGAWTKKKDAATCMAAYKTMMSLKDTVKPNGDDDALLNDPVSFLYSAAPSCLGKAGDCGQARQVFLELFKIKAPKAPNPEQSVDMVFPSIVPSCKRK